MDRSLEKLIRTMERLASMYEELLALSREKTQCLVACDTAGLEALQAREDMSVTKLNQMSSARDSVLAEVAQIIKLDPRQAPTISAILLRLGNEEPEAREELAGIRNRLKSLGSELATANRLNEELCTQSLMHLQGFMDLLTGRAGKSTMYDARGRSQQHSSRALVNRSA